MSANVMQPTLVAGPPGAGKSTWVREQFKPGDVVIDYDAIMMAISGQPEHCGPRTLHWFAYRAIQALYEEVVANRERTGEVYIVACVAGPWNRSQLVMRLGARTVLLNPGREVCLERVKQRTDGRDWEAAVRGWYADEVKPPDIGRTRTRF